MDKFILYYLADCHLCGEAESLLHAAGLGESYRKVDIEADPELLERYGVHIPVLKHAGGRAELRWPFDRSSLERFLDGR